MAYRSLFLMLMIVSSLHADGNRLSYLNGPIDPYYVNRDFARLATPQWVGEKGVDAVVVLAIDDMRDAAHYERYLRPILDRLKEIDGRAPVSIMTNQVDSNDPQLQKWLREGLTIEVHTADHPCPLLHGGDFAKAKSTYDRCVDALAKIDGNRPVAFRMPCCDSMNTPSPRFWSEIFSKATAHGNFLHIDSSVFNITTASDPQLSEGTTIDAAGQPRFQKYLPFPSYVNTINDYPYPYVIGHMCWEFPCVVPSDWEAQNLHRPNNPQTVEDMKCALDAVVTKQGVYNLVFHPHGWIRNDQIVAIIDYAVEKYAGRVKFLTFREAHERLAKHLMLGRALRDETGEDAGVRILDVNGDCWMDVLLPEANASLTTRVWHPEESRWRDLRQPVAIESAEFGVVDGKNASFVTRAGNQFVVFTFKKDQWKPQTIPQQLALGEVKPSSPVHWRLFDVDGDGRCELLVEQGESRRVLMADGGAWKPTSFQLPPPVRLDEKSRQSWRFVALGKKGVADIVLSTPNRYAVYRFDGEQGWSATIDHDRRSPDAGDQPIPAFVRGDGTDNGAWIHSQHIWLQNEDTDRLPEKVDRVSFEQLRAEP